MRATARDALGRLSALLAAEGGLVAQALRSDDAPEGPAGPDPAGPRTTDRLADYELVIEAVYEGYLLHYGESRLLQAGDPDLALLAGDRLYALGLSRLVELGDLVAVAELADVIALTACAHAAADAELAQAVWEAGATAVGWGSSPEHADAKRDARRGAQGAAQRLRAAARSQLAGGRPAHAS